VGRSNGSGRTSLRFCARFGRGGLSTAAECRIQPRFAVTVTDLFGLRSRASGIFDCGVPPCFPAERF
jgi:hypothetical protein